MTDLILPMRQRVWGLPAVINFTAGGMGAGLYVMALIIEILFPGISGRLPQRLLDITSLLLVAGGLAALAAEAGRPWRGIYLLANLGRSWMSREVAAAIILIAAAGLDWFHPQPLFRAVGAAGAFSLILSHGLILGKARAVIAWNVLVVPAVFLTSGLTAGMAMVLLFASAGLFRPDEAVFMVCLLTLWADISLWLTYLYAHDGRDFMKVTKRMRQRGPLAFHTGLGLLLPFVLTLLLFVAGGLIGDTGCRLIAAAAGSAMIAGGAFRKAGMLLWSNYLRPISIGGPAGSLLHSKMTAHGRTGMWR